MPAAAALFPPCAGTGLRLGLGGAPLGNLFEAVADADAQAVVEAAWASGCRSFDTAPHYGHGLSERRLGDALRGRDRAAFVLSSKIGRLLTAQADAPRDQHGYVDTPPVVPPLVVVLLGIWTRRAFEPLLVGCLVGFVMISPTAFPGNFVEALKKTLVHILLQYMDISYHFFLSQ